MEGGGSGRACPNAPKSGAPEMPAKQGHPAGPLGLEGGAGRTDKEDDGATGVAKLEVAAGDATHPAPTGAEGGRSEGGAMDARSMGVASPNGEAEAGEAGFLPGEEAS
ncbi:collagen alpha-1(III) chain-like [Drosophila ananassae]|uniref:collagen alpha-1(III) chain-like n=1 Tax=Drosophila ananassae TaxID=7217 RepID=UPI001CFFB76E|nr:collagen alpha-1(III) chain-like [Drosophila ananassae]